jgi:hypothetical protein
MVRYFFRRDHLECGDLSPLCTFLSALEPQAGQSGHKSPHSKWAHPPLGVSMKPGDIPLSRQRRAILVALALALPLAAAFLVPAVADYCERRGLIRIADGPANSVVLSVWGQHFSYFAGLFQFHLTFFSLLAGVFLAAYVAYPELSPALAELRPQWKAAYTAAALALTCEELAAFVVHYGNRQFGGFDCSLLIDVGWRLIQGQRPYRDFICTLPPGFYLGVKYAFQIFGVRWDALLFVTAIFSAATFLWIYFLLAAILESRSLAYLGAVTIQCCGVLSVSYWWYNSVTMIAATIFFLSCVLYLQRTSEAGPQVSYVVALALLGLMKPNVAFLTAAGGVVFSLLATPRKVRLLLLTLAAVGVNLAFLLANHVSLTGMIAGYLAAAADRGLTIAGIAMEGPPDSFRLVTCVLVLLAPLLVWGREFLQDFRQSDFESVARGLLLLCGPVVTFYATFTDMELKDVEWPLLCCFGLILLGKRWPEDRGRFARAYFCFLLALTASDLYLGAARFRVAHVGDFFSPSGKLESPGVPFFAHMKASHRLRGAVEAVEGVLAYHPRPIFFGPRMEFAYAAFRLPSPPGLPVWWHPGTSFRRTDEPAILRTWRDQCFQTLVFLKNDYPYYSPEFHQTLDSLYMRDDFWVSITVFRRRVTASCSPAVPASR